MARYSVMWYGVVWCVVRGVVWCGVVCDVWSVVCGARCVVCGVWCLGCGLWGACVVCGVWCVLGWFGGEWICVWWVVRRSCGCGNSWWVEEADGCVFENNGNAANC